jgi:hypothetical protein
MYSLKLGTGTAVVLTDRRLIKQLIDKKSNIYSNRPPSFVSHNLITGGDHLLVMQYGNLWRSFRKLIHQYFMESMVEREHIVLQNAEAVQMIHDYMRYPKEHMRHPKRYSNSIIMSLRKSFLLEYVKSMLCVIFMACGSKFYEPLFCCESYEHSATSSE